MSNTDSLDFLFQKPTRPFRVIKRKGALRYIASNRFGSLGAVTKFAPPSKPLPRLVLKAGSFIDFRFPGRVGRVNLSERFLSECARCLDIPPDRLGIYVGEPNDHQKLVVTDIAGESDFVLKIAAGIEADLAIRREAEGGRLALGVGRWEGMVPEVRTIEPVCGKSAILIERIKGRQLTPKEFERLFFERGALSCKLLAVSTMILDAESEKLMADGQVISVGEWFRQNLMPNAESLEPLLTACRESGALDLRFSLGLVHGDFAPWNVIRREVDSVRYDVLSVKQDKNLKPNHLKRKTGNSQRLCLIDWEFSRADTPLIFDLAYAAWCFDELLGRNVSSIDSNLWKQLVSLGALWKEIRGWELGS